MKYKEPKKANITEHRVIVTPSSGIWSRDPVSRQHDYAKEIIDQIKRHVDNVDRVEIDTVVDYTCNFCGYAWNPDANGLNSCCSDETMHWISNNMEKAIASGDWKDEIAEIEAKKLESSP